MAVEPDTFSPVVSYQYQDTLGDMPGQQVISPIVSYQYLDSLDDSPATSPIFSKVVSYQYFDWPGDENLTFQYSPNVSYYFSGGVAVAVTGTIRMSGGLPVGGALIKLKRYGTVFWTGTSDANGNFSAPGLLAADYKAVVTKADYVTSITDVRGDSGGSLALNLELTALPPPLPTVAVNRVPAASAIGQTGAGTAHLRVLRGTQFTTDFTHDSEFDPSRPTIVLSHGWKSGVDGPDDWVKPMAVQIRNRIGTGAANILAWDWSGEANRELKGAIDVAAMQGEHLGKALYEKLGATYSQHVHFIGHSFGTIVNANACDFVHGRIRSSGVIPATGWQKAQTTPHITLMDEAEIGSIDGQMAIVSAEAGAKIAGIQGGLFGYGVGLVAGWKEPIPHDYEWIDNYISAVGFHRDEAVNVCLVAPTLAFQFPQSLAQLKQEAFSAHEYSHQWYAGSVPASVTSAAIGFSSSLETGAGFPPSGSGKTPGSEWYEQISTPDLFDLTRNPLDLGVAGLVIGSVDFPIFQTGALLSLRGAATVGNEVIYKPLDALGRAVLEGSEMTVKFAGNVGGTVIYKTGQVVSATRQKVGLWWDATYDEVQDFTSSLDPRSLITGPLGASVWSVGLKKQASSPPLVGAGKGGVAGVAATSQPAYAWVSVAVPADAGLMAFDFKVTGDPQDDVIACAINEQNVFTLPARFAPDGQTVSTDLIDVTAYAGQTVELFFGLTGGSSTDCEVTIDGVRFITVPKPKLGIGVAGGNIVLKWPAAAAGWVLETSDSLAPGSWQDVPPATAVTVDRGVATMEQPAVGLKKFYRLRRSP